jgi:hypothetical protein
VSLCEGWWCGQILPEDQGEGRGGSAVVAGVTAAGVVEDASHNPPCGCCGSGGRIMVNAFWAALCVWIGG